ncbi:MAG: alpha/beta fold hydrolase [Armatimonadota bacterium]|nr:alpha/beta fold hydrolase [Armatimonadota bacterium]MDR7452241.1 alpha/beta fold hydrolase [Armatimonadota bacterium]MDR7466664.1 alpha/beta fold hydrolase [Armatimonadota bacterium]MDR7492862.1 alpha/beta fold hydrolase [Armatimonadota bacterium]MDR7498638.1 alpha/beta fold hydrolase [Armatimonadota bacterium]
MTADANIQAAIAHWAPRFVAQGVDYNDFVRTTALLQQWEEWLEAWCRTAATHVALAREAEDRARPITAGEAYVRAALCFHFANFLWFVDLDRHRAAAEEAVASLYAAHRLLDPSAQRIEASLEGARMVANLRRPAGGGRPPLVLLLPGLDSTKEEFFHWEQVFLARGMATLSLDGPGQGETGYTTTIRPDYEVAVTAVLDALAGRDDIDLRRVGAVGVSLGGYYAIRAAAFEPRIAAAVAISGPYNFGECWPSLPELTREAFRHHCGAQRAEEARVRASDLDLAPVLPHLRSPLLVIAGRQDRLIPPVQAERTAAEAPDAELVMYPEGNHVCNNIPYKYRPLAADWIGEQLRAPRTGPRTS